MRKNEETGLDFVVDKLTNSIENVITGDSFATEISILTTNDLKTINKKNGWLFNWRIEYMNPAKDVYKLTIVNNPTVIQGLVSLEVKEDHVFMHLVENASFNKGKTKVYAGVAGNLVAFACKLSFQRGHEGNVSFISKTQLIHNYEKSLGAYHFGGRLMVIETKTALKLMINIFKTCKMKTKKLELDVDFIGGQDALASEEEKALSEFFKKQKSLPKKGKTISKSRTVRREKVTT